MTREVGSVPAGEVPRRTELPVPEPDLTSDEMVGRAVGMRPVLRERQEECERQRTLPPETHAAFGAAGFYRILQPRRFGGYEFGVPTFMRVVIELARGCPASGWVLALTAGHAHTVSSYLPARTQAEFYGTDGEFRAPLTGLPGGNAIPADGGYRVSGAWDYTSGCDTATHFIGSALVPGEVDGGPPAEVRYIAVPRAAYEIVDNWDVLGMCGTGSKRVVINDAYVPGAHTFPASSPERDVHAEMCQGVHANPMYAGRMNSLLFCEVAAVGVGTARAALDAYADLLRTKKTTFPPPIPRSESQEHQRHFGRAYGLIDLAEAAALKGGEDYMEWSRRAVQDGVPFTEEHDRRLLMRYSQVVRLAAEAIELMFRTAGTGSTRRGGLLQRYLRDIATVQTHIGLQTDHTAVNLARLYFGHRPHSVL